MHGPTGKGIEAAGFPNLTGQKIDYTIKTLKDFRSGYRNNDMNGMMRDIAKAMTDEQVKLWLTTSQVCTKPLYKILMLGMLIRISTSVSAQQFLPTDDEPVAGKDYKLLIILLPTLPR